MTRWDIINHFILARNYKSFLEIGTGKGDTFRRVLADERTSVDPDPATNATYIMTSDEYFMTHNEKFDIIFIDGLHLCQQAYRDIQNSLKHLNAGGVVVMHDCDPGDSYVMQIPNPNIGKYRSWTGDVWKAFVKARALLPYELYVITEDLGCGIIDTTIQKFSDTSSLPINMESMTFTDLVTHTHWLNYQTKAL